MNFRLLAEYASHIEKPELDASQISSTDESIAADFSKLQEAVVSLQASLKTDGSFHKNAEYQAYRRHWLNEIKQACAAVGAKGTTSITEKVTEKDSGKLSQDLANLQNQLNQYDETIKRLETNLVEYLRCHVDHIGGSYPWLRDLDPRHIIRTKLDKLLSLTNRDDKVGRSIRESRINLQRLIDGILFVVGPGIGVATRYNQTIRGSATDNPLAFPELRFKYHRDFFGFEIERSPSDDEIFRDLTKLLSVLRFIAQGTDANLKQLGEKKKERKDVVQNIEALKIRIESQKKRESLETSVLSSFRDVLNRCVQGDPAPLQNFLKRMQGEEFLHFRGVLKLEEIADREWTKGSSEWNACEKAVVLAKSALQGNAADLEASMKSLSILPLMNNDVHAHRDSFRIMLGFREQIRLLAGNLDAIDASVQGFSQELAKDVASALVVDDEKRTPEEEKLLEKLMRLMKTSDDLPRPLVDATDSSFPDIVASINSGRKVLHTAFQDSRSGIHNLVQPLHGSVIEACGHFDRLLLVARTFAELSTGKDINPSPASKQDGETMRRKALDEMVVVLARVLLQLQAVIKSYQISTQALSSKANSDSHSLATIVLYVSEIEHVVDNDGNSKDEDIALAESLSDPIIAVRILKEMPLMGHEIRLIPFPKKPPLEVIAGDIESARREIPPELHLMRSHAVILGANRTVARYQSKTSS